MKKILILLLSIFLVSFDVSTIHAEEYNLCNIFSIKFLTGYSDQDNTIKVTRFINKQTGKDGFCMEPYTAYKPAKFTYERKLCDDQEIYQLVKDYELYSEKSDEDYIATQLMIWKYLTGNEYTFDGKGINDYLHYSGINLLVNDEDDTYLDYTIDYNSQYNYEDISTENADINAKDIEVIDADTLTVKELDETIENASVDITYNYDKQNSIYYYSENSQNIYSFEGDYKASKKLFLNFSINPTYTNVYFHKYDLEGNDIEGAEFSIYKEDDINGEKIIFLQNNIKVNLKEVLLDESEQSYSIELSERFEQYFDGTFIQTGEIGYFDYSIYNGESLIRTGRVYVTNNTDFTDNYYKIVSLTLINTGFSTTGTSKVENVPINSELYLCESEPAKGYVYASEPCKLVSTDQEHREDVHEFYNDTRSFTLRLVKENSDKNIALDGAKFKISYNDESGLKEIYFTTGALNISNPSKAQYLHYLYSGSTYIDDTNGEDFIKNNMNPGKYYYYFSNDLETDTSRLTENYTYVVDGGYTIEDIPYNSLITVEELQAPEGYFISEAQYTIMANIPYSEITFKNYRVNEAIVLPAKKRKMVKTCVDD